VRLLTVGPSCEAGGQVCAPGGRESQEGRCNGQMTDELRRRGHCVNHKRVERLIGA